MTLLWFQATEHTAMPWWNNEREHEYEGDDEYPLRDPEESLRQRGQRYKQQVMDNHGVTGPVAQKAIQHVVKKLKDNTVWDNPSRYGFTTTTNKPLSHLVSLDASTRIHQASTWRDVPVQHVPLDRENIHATQDFVRPSSIAHNLFHPGKHQTWDDEAVGDPDYDPADDHDNSEDDHEDNQHTSHPRFVKMNDGRMMTLDGHHRVATDLLLGKTHTQGRVVHERDLE